MNHDTAITSSPTPSTRTNVIVLVALLVLLGLTIGLAFIDLDRLLHARGWSMSVALLIALAKALLIVTWFMHLKYAKRIILAAAAAGFVWLGILLVLTFSDFLTRWPVPGSS
jgi:cytochrome c oxidase subunit 4